MAGLLKAGAGRGKAAPQPVLPAQLLADDAAQEASLHADFSPAAVSRAVLKATAQSPLVLYPLSLGLLGGLAALLLSPMTLFLATAAGGLGLGLGAWLVNGALRRERYASAYLQRMHQLLQGQVEQSIGRLQQELEQAGLERGLSQLRRLRAKFQVFQELLARKLDAEELTYSRYLGMTEQVFLAGLDNLSRVVSIQQGVSAIDEAHVSARLQELDRQGQRGPVQEQEYQALSERLALRQTQLDKTETLLMQNEAAMTQMDRIMAAIAELDTSQGRASMDMESAMQELQRLASRAADYGR
jgi:hypothetical protein